MKDSLHADFLFLFFYLLRLYYLIMIYNKIHCMIAIG